MRQMSPTVTPSHLSHLIGWCDCDATGDRSDGPSQLRQDATQSATRRDMRRAAKSAQYRCSCVSTGRFRLTRLPTLTDFHIRCLRHRKCPYFARFCDRDNCLDPISSPRAPSALVANIASPSLPGPSTAGAGQRGGGGRATLIATAKKTGGGCRGGGKPIASENFTYMFAFAARFQNLGLRAVVRCVDRLVRNRPRQGSVNHSTVNETC
jgi:hypothetical protein